MRVLTPKGLDHLVLEVRNIEEALGFHCRVLGCQAERVAPYRAREVPFPSVRAGSSLIDRLVAEHPSSGPSHFCLEVAGTEETLLAGLAAVGLPFETPGRGFGAKGDGFSLHVKDPDGHRIELRTYDAGSPGNGPER
jgi:catechol 2,3-dioxygenase-like lactoylglutathione lyase family enzyme